ncbi:hypothetical protein IQ37_13860 [Chryseobacterium piperi]|uniref:DoxX family protein n=1 Tax=Chryseobacterium piperi TaxID=558152 RepID=A0A086B4J8_9FLAO|nr:DoxX family protein [Chryseobacterium piperi]ASW73134.1 hypothetical protein CJF12_01745 [Chryseobacterium piperi]KFF23862.1 hypothetical protein IQ37_13860 [Chryseobacterium piperi]
MILKIVSIALILVAVYMGFKQGWAMISGKAEMLQMLGKLGMSASAVMILGVITLLSAVMILIPQTFVWGNFIMAGTILLIMCLELFHGDIKGALIEFPFIILNLIIIYLNYPFKFS